MANTSARPADELERVMQTYGNMLFRVASQRAIENHKAIISVSYTVVCLYRALFCL